MKLPKSHPRYLSLTQRHLVEEGVRGGITHPQGLIAQGRGEAFDYLIGERTQGFARKAVKAAAAMLLLAKNPVISVNGNVAALCPREVVELANEVNAKLEVNLFYRSERRAKLIAKELRKNGAAKVYGAGKTTRLKGLESKRGIVDHEGIGKADVVLVMLEDGDRTEALRKMGKRVIAVDLNPLSRTAQMADVTIVDNVARCLPLLTTEVRKMKKLNSSSPRNTVKKFDNGANLREALAFIRKGF